MGPWSSDYKRRLMNLNLNPGNGLNISLKINMFFNFFCVEKDQKEAGNGSF